MSQRLSFFDEEDLPSSKKSTKKEKVVTISQGRKSNFNLYPSKNESDVRYIPNVLVNLNVNYGVRLLINNDKQKEQLDFEINVSISDYKGNSVYLINRKDIYINNGKPKTTLEEVASLCGKVLYPIAIDISDYSIMNVDEIKNRWVVLRKKLKERYQGDFVDNYINSMEQVLKNNLAMNQALRQDMFLSIWKHISETRAYDQSLKSKVVFDFPLVPFSKPIRYIGSQNVKKHYTNYNTIKTNFKGKISDNRSVKDLKDKNSFPLVGTQAESKPESSCKIGYDLDRKTGVLKFCKSKVKIDLEGEISSVEITINQI